MTKLDYRKFELQQAKQESDEVATISCPRTQIELYFTAGSDKIYVFESFGECCDCHMHVHTSALEANISPSEWPVQYLGYICKECYSKEDEEVALTEEEEKLLQQEPDEDEEE